MSEPLKHSAVITGVSTGIGYATAKLLVERGFQVFGSVRSEADAERVAQEFGPNYCALIMDVTDETAVRRSADTVREKLGQNRLFALINNAGIGMTGPFAYPSLDRFRPQSEVTLGGGVWRSEAFLPLSGPDPP